MSYSFHPFEGGYEIHMRVVGANIHYEWLIYILMWIPIGIFLYGVYKRVRIWMQARGENERKEPIGPRSWSFLYNTLRQIRVIEKPLPGWMHFF